MTLALLAAAVLLLLVLIARLKFSAFLALLATSFAVGLAYGMSPEKALQSILKGIGDTMGSLALILVFGAVLGKRIEESGAAHAISAALGRVFGEKHIQASVLVTGFLVGLPMIYNASFLVLIPLVYTLSSSMRLPLMYLGIPLSSALSVTHGYLPPHPAPTSIAILYGADVNLTLLYGLVLAVPATILAGPVLARFFRNLHNSPPAHLFESRVFSAGDLPGLGVSLLTVLAPVILMLAGAAVSLGGWTGPLADLCKFVSEPTVALFLAVSLSLWTLGLARGFNMESLMKSVAAAAASVSMVMLIIAAGGAFKQVLIDGGAAEGIKQVAAGLAVSPLLLAWSTAALLRLALGSATVAAITAAGIVLPLVRSSGTLPELLVLATTSGSLMFSHFNDIGFWMFKEYYNVSIRQTFQIWTVMESIVAVAGLLGVFALQQILAPPPRLGVYVNSYHEGYSSSDDVMAAIRERFGERRIPLEVFFLDAKRRPEEAPDRAAEIVKAIRARKPDILLVSDDDAAQWIVAPHFRGGPMPVVFCGVNWDATQYGFPSPFVTGMVEVMPVIKTLDHIRKQFPSATKLMVLSEDSLSERNNTRLLEPKYREHGWQPSFHLVRTFEEWKAAFRRAQKEADVIYLPTNGSIRHWDAGAARAWAVEHTAKPTFTNDDFMMPYAAFGLVKIAREQGEWAAQTALAILGGAKPTDFALSANQRTECHFNSRLAQASGLRQPSSLACSEVPGQ